MAEIFRITGKNNILFDAPPPGNYRFTQGRPPRKLSTVLTRKEVLAVLPRLPLGIRPLALQHGLSVVTMEINIHGVSNTDMEAREHDLIETLVEADLYCSSLGDMGTRAVLMVNSDDLVVQTSYKTIFFGVIDELDARDVLGSLMNEHSLVGLRLILYCEPHWRPDVAVQLGPNEIQVPSFEEDGNADGLADYWSALNVPVTSIENVIVLHGCDSQQIDTNMVGEGIASATMVAPAGVTDAVAYAWICRPAAGTDIIVILRDTTNNVSRDTRLYSTAGWETEEAGGETWYRVVVSSNAIVPAANHQLWIYSVTDAATTFYVDETMWIWDTLVAPDEWIGHYTVWNHYDAACNGHLDHVNYLDIDRLKGDVDCRLRIEMESLFSNATGTGELTVARRTDPCRPCQFVHFLEGEDATTQTNWADAVAVSKSGCAFVSNSAATAGHVIWDYTTLGYDLACQKGRFRVLGCLLASYSGAEDENIKFKASVGMVGAYQESKWIQPLIAGTWHWLDFGVFEVTGQFWGDELPSTLYWRVDYEKEAADTVNMDFLLLLPEDESVLRILLGDRYLVTNEDVLWDNTFDFIHAMKRNTADAFVWHPPVQAEPLALAPDEENRLIFAMGHYVSASFPYKGCYVHEDNGEHMRVSLKYLPQFVSPLE